MKQNQNYRSIIYQAYCACECDKEPWEAKALRQQFTPSKEEALESLKVMFFPLRKASPTAYYFVAITATVP